MVSLPDAFAGIALGFSSLVCGPYHPGRIIDHGQVQYDDAGDVIPGTGGPVYRDCSVQIDLATEAMRQDSGYAEGDMRCMILASTLRGTLNTDAVVEVLEGPHVGIWHVSSLSRDPAGIGWTGRGRRA